MKKTIIAILFLCVLNSCATHDAAEDPDNLNPVNSYFDLYFGSSYSNMFYHLFGNQISENLVDDSFTRQLATPTPYLNGVNNTTYYITWNSYWDNVFLYVIAPSEHVIGIAKSHNLPMFANWGKFIQILAMSKLTAYHGPVIYSNYGSTGSTILYDKESDLYTRFFTELDSIQAVFKANKTYEYFKKYDTSYNGDVVKWMKVVNSMRLRLAIRISKVAPSVAKTQGEKAMSDPAGLITTNADNFSVNLNGNILPIAQICFNWDDTRMDAAMESFLIGLKDNRISSFFQPATDNTLYPEHPDYPYKGIRSGAYLDAKDQRLAFSKIANSFNSVTTRRYMTAAEVYFLKAEAALRGWKDAGNAKEDYETGVRLSFEDWKATGVDTYLADATSKPIDYIDPKDSRNNFTTRSTITVAWNEADSPELKLEKIITQKWINNFTNSLESWVDFRRTGYPKLPYNAKNDSNADWGIIAPNDFIKRMPFVDSERKNNAAGVADAVSKMGTGAKDDIATRLWWDTGASNF
ncbi:MAG: SusD/RagB family nutrient-binding outer membrane lipoprotein [Bacteroidota bacterium]|nr:SusD/RagB family nutrient-binding outer membrane lipoprotein [Bacteroidota bacterium]